MKKYSDQILNDYISGNNVDEYSLEQLETDAVFIKEVVDFSNDKNIYNLCNDKLKKNFELMKYFILKFKEDKKFIAKVSGDFSRLSDDETNIFEINILAESPAAYATFFGLCISYYSDIKEINEMTDKNCQMGFLVFLKIYSDRKVILDYIAKQMMYDIFKQIEDFSLSDLIYKEFINADSLNKVDIFNFLIKLMAFYDLSLSEYFKNNLHVFEEIGNEINLIIDNFSNYKAAKKNEAVNWMIDFLIDYSIKTGYSDGKLLIKWISSQLGLVHPAIDSVLNDHIIVEVDDSDYYDFTIEEINSDFEEIEHFEIEGDNVYLRLLDIVMNVFRTLDIPDDIENESYFREYSIMRLQKKDNID